MTDITMCRDGECPFRESCFRYLATPSGWQSYFDSSPREPDGRCAYFRQAWNRPGPAKDPQQGGQMAVKQEEKRQDPNQ